MLTHIVVTPMCMQLLHVQHVTRSGSPHNVMRSSMWYMDKYCAYKPQIKLGTAHSLVQHVQNLVLIMMFNVEVLVVA